MNVVVGLAVFMLVLGMALSGLELLPRGLFEPSEAPLASAKDQDTTAQFSTDAENPAESPEDDGLMSFAQSDPVEPDPPADHAPLENASDRLAQDDLAGDSVRSETQGLASRHRQVYERAIESLRLADPASLREMIQIVEGMLSSPQSPDWAPEIRLQLHQRLERSQFARLP